MVYTVNICQRWKGYDYYLENLNLVNTIFYSHRDTNQMGVI